MSICFPSFFVHCLSAGGSPELMTDGRGGGAAGGPLFPRINVSDAADKRGPRAAPRNKMALYEQLSVPSAAAATAPLRPSNFAPALSTTAAPQGSGQGRSMYSYCSPHQMSMHSIGSTVPDREKVGASRGFKRNSVRHVDNNRRSNSSELVAENTSLYGHETLMRINEDDEFSVPTFTKIAPYSRKETCNTGLRGSSSSFGNVIQKSVRFRSIVQNPSSKRRSITLKEQNEVVASHQKIGESRLSHVVTGSSYREKIPRQKVIQNLDETRVEGFAESWGNHNSNSFKCLNQENAVGNGNNTNLDGDAVGGNDLGDAERHELSETSVVDSVSCNLEISPDDVVAVIGPKHFWKARRAIINQQRVFALQVFELHRLITVQKLIAASPELHSGGNIYTKNPEQKKPNRNIPLKNSARMEAQQTQQKYEHLNPIRNSNFATVDARTNPPVSCEDHKIKEHQRPTAVPVQDNMRGQWCYQQPSNQWLIPVMSPSEGLLYKPIATPLLPSSGYMAPVYGNYGIPMGMPPMETCNMFTPSTDQATASNYLNPYSSPLLKSLKSNKRKDNHSYITQDMSVPKSEVLSGSLRTNQANKETELQDRMTNSCCTRNQEGQATSTLSESTQLSQSHNKDQQIRVIKVIPHNAKSATESAARIFRSIQEERQKV